MQRIRASFFILLFLFSLSAFADGKPFQKIFVVVFENTNVEDSLQQPFMKSLLKQGAFLSDFHAEAHPSQPNYIAMVAGDTLRVRSNNNYDLNERHIGDLLEDKGLNWKSYLESYPGGCYTKSISSDGLYWRKHAPFISFKNVSQDKERCQSHIVNADQLKMDVESGHLPEYSLYVPGIRNDGHDTGVAYADRWLAATFGPLLKDPRFMQDMLFVITFDENEPSDDRDDNRIYTLLLGNSVRPGSQSGERLDHYSLLKLIEDTFSLGSLGRRDVSALPITKIWK